MKLQAVADARTKADTEMDTFLEAIALRVKERADKRRTKTMIRKEPYLLDVDTVLFLQEVADLAIVATGAAVHKYPQPNYVLLKIAEEAGEVVKAGVHLSEGRDCSWEDLQFECIQTIAMCMRLLIEGDQTLGLTPPKREV